MKTENTNKGSKNSGSIFDYSNLKENLELFSYKNKKVINQIEIEYRKKHLD